MAEQLSEFQFDHTSQYTKYPWDEWMQGGPWVVERGVDYDATTKSFRAYLHNKARIEDKKVRTKIVDDKTVVFQFYGDEDE